MSDVGYQGYVKQRNRLPLYIGIVGFLFSIGAGYLAVNGMPAIMGAYNNLFNNIPQPLSPIDPTVRYFLFGY